MTTTQRWWTRLLKHRWLTIITLGLIALIVIFLLRWTTGADRTAYLEVWKLLALVVLAALVALATGRALARRDQHRGDASNGDAHLASAEVASPTARLAAVLMIGGGYVAALAGFGLSVFASESFPLAFGIDLWGDRQYPFPAGHPMVAFAGLMMIAAAALFGFVLIRAARHERWARQLAIGVLIAAAGIAAAVSYGASNERRCAISSYSNVEHCMPRPAAAARDFVPIGVPALVAAVLLAREPKR